MAMPTFQRFLLLLAVWSAALSAAVYANAVWQRETHSFYGAMTAASEAGFLNPGMCGVAVLAAGVVMGGTWYIFFVGLVVEDAEKFAVSMLLHYTELLISVVLCHVLVGSSVKLGAVVELCAAAAWRLLHLAMVARTEGMEHRGLDVPLHVLGVPVVMLAITVMTLRSGANRKATPLNAHLAHSLYSMSITSVFQIVRRGLYYMQTTESRRAADWSTATDHRTIRIGVLMLSHLLQFANHVGLFVYCLLAMDVPAVNVLRPLYSEFYQASREFFNLRLRLTLDRRIDECVPDATKEQLEADPDAVCAICFEGLGCGDACGVRVKRLYPCGHMFHRNCIVGWFYRSLTCPYCRQKIQKPPKAKPAKPKRDRTPLGGPKKPPHERRMRDNMDVPAVIAPPLPPLETERRRVTLDVDARPAPAAPTIGNVPAERPQSPVATIFMNDGLTDHVASRDWSRAVRIFVQDAERAASRFHTRVQQLHR
eukprot:TRINITY_DN12251_c0_g1_i1.p1 TRINITY_DN12251_c0_g1~~TRINITY_DN12251_c0_g1_i1.p1  ORF type:complete len:481 (+),score=129.84 TRINITY_DN12251_c0_g1_i1:99-1541(+)